MKVILKNSSLVFQAQQEYEKQIEEYSSLSTAFQNNIWRALTTNANSGEIWKVKIEGSPNWSGNTVIGFSAEDNTQPVNSNMALITATNKGVFSNITLNINASYLCVSIPKVDDASGTLTVTIQRVS